MRSELDLMTHNRVIAVLWAALSSEDNRRVLEENLVEDHHTVNDANVDSNAESDLAGCLQHGCQGV